MEQKLAQLQAKLEADPSIVEKLFALETPEEVQGLFKEQGLDFTLEEIDALRDALVKTLEQGATDELSDDDLEDVAGGVVITAATVGAIAAVVSATATTGGFVHTVSRGRW